MVWSGMGSMSSAAGGMRPVVGRQAHLLQQHRVARVAADVPEQRVEGDAAEVQARHAEPTALADGAIERCWSSDQVTGLCICDNGIR